MKHFILFAAILFALLWAILIRAEGEVIVREGSSIYDFSTETSSQPVVPPGYWFVEKDNGTKCWCFD